MVLSLGHSVLTEALSVASSNYFLTGNNFHKHYYIRSTGISNSSLDILGFGPADLGTDDDLADFAAFVFNLSGVGFAIITD